MTYKDMFVTEIKYKGKILRVKDDTVYLPFNSEYSLLFKNLNSRRAAVKISIDGQDVLEGKSLVVNPNETKELEGFLSGMIATNKFKFIQKTKQIQDYRGDKIDDGIVRIEFAYEKPTIKWTFTNSIQYVNRDIPLDVYGNLTNSPRASFQYSSINSNVSNISSYKSELNENLNYDEGITVKGSECSQQFSYITMNSLENPEVIIIRLKGLTELGNEIVKPVTVREKLICKTCGTRSSSSNKFCSNCGTFLE